MNNWPNVFQSYFNKWFLVRSLVIFGSFCSLSAVFHTWVLLARWWDADWGVWFFLCVLSAWGLTVLVLVVFCYKFKWFVKLGQSPARSRRGILPRPYEVRELVGFISIYSDGVLRWILVFLSDRAFMAECFLRDYFLDIGPLPLWLITVAWTYI